MKIIIKRLIPVLFMLVSIFNISAYAEPVAMTEDDIPDGYVDVTAEMPEGLTADVQFDLKNITTNEVLTVSLSHSNNNTTHFFANFGVYEMVEGTDRVTSVDKAILDCKVSVEPFEIGESNPNGNWSWYIKAIVKANGAVPNETKKTELEGAIKDYLQNENSNNGNNTHSDESNNKGVAILTIPTTDTYFPGMTLDEIKEWYINEVNNFNSTGGTNVRGKAYTLEEFQKSVANWAKWIFEDKKNQSYSEYKAMVEGYDSDNTRGFYEAQKKLYDFIKSYEENNNVMLNFEVWEKTSSNPNTSENITTEEKIQQIENDTKDIIDENNTIKDKNETVDNHKKKSNNLIDKLKTAWLTIIIIIVVIIGGIVWRIKYNKSEE